MSTADLRQISSAEWWDETKGDAHGALIRVFGAIRNQSGWRRDADKFHIQLYSGSTGASGLQSRAGDYTYGPATLPYNVCRSSVDTLVAKIAQHRPLPQVLSARGNWRQQRRALKMNQYVEGEFYRHRIFERWGKTIVRDAATVGRGFLKIVRAGRRSLVERADPREVFVDEWDARYGDPRNIYHVRSMDAGVVKERFARSDSGRMNGDMARAIDGAVNKSLWPEGEIYNTHTTTVQRVDVVEAWHLCDDEDAHEFDEDHKCTGRHVICIDGFTLLDELWERPYLPFAVLRYNEPFEGFIGQGLVEQLEGYQYQINLASERLAEMYRLTGVSIVVQNGSDVVDSEVRNGIGNIIHCKGGMAPQVLPIDLVNEHMRARPRELTQDALNDAGLSQMSVQSQKPQGIQSGIALQTLDDVATERFIVFGRAYESWCLEVARILVDNAKEIAEQYGDYSVKVQMKGGLLELSWKDVALDGFEMKVFPTSMLPQEPAAKLDKAKALFEAGVIPDRASFIRLLDLPDFSAEADIEVADKLNIDDRLECMLALGEGEDDDWEPTGGEADDAYKPPNPYLDLKWAARRGQQKLNKAESDGAPEYVLDLLRRWVLDCQDLDAKANPPPEPAPMPAPPMPPGPPMGAPPPDLGMGMAPMAA